MSIRARDKDIDAYIGLVYIQHIYYTFTQ